MNRFLILIITVLALSAHGKTGHRVVGKIAEDLLTDKAKMEIKKILGHTNLASVSNWADFIKSDSNWRHASSWHYMTVPDDLRYENSREKKDGKYVHSGLIADKIIEFSELLKSKKGTAEERENALKFLVHFLGDLHQPHHVGNGKDRGGNQVDVKWFGSKTNLHSVWDSKMIDFTQLSYTEYAMTLMQTVSDDEIKKWQSSSLGDWVNESKEIRMEIYKHDYTKNLYFDYIFKFNAVSEQRLRLAGVRLAKVLNEAFN